LSHELEDDEYIAEKIVADRLMSGKREYLVKWQGYADKYNTWEPLENLANLTDEIAAFQSAKDAAGRIPLSTGCKLIRLGTATDAARRTAGAASRLLSTLPRRWARKTAPPARSARTPNMVAGQATTAW
jgi:hypothetical protein